jgi:hypothetical protein
VNSHLNDVAGKLLQAANAASAEIKKYLGPRKDESRFLQDDVYRHILQIEKPYHILVGTPPTPMKEFKGDVVQFALRGNATTDPKICLALVSVLGLELQRLGENKNFVLHVVSAQGTGFTFNYAPPLEAKHFVEGAADVNISPVIFRENFL